MQQSFVKLLSELEKEGMLDLSQWIELRDARNRIAHEYPDNEESLTSSINFIYEHSGYPMKLTNRLERYFNEITTKRNSSN